MSGWTPHPRAWTGGPLAEAAWGLLGAAVVLAFVAVWVVVPAPASALLPFGVAAPELSPALSLVALAVAAAAWALRRRRPSRVGRRSGAVRGRAVRDSAGAAAVDRAPVRCGDGRGWAGRQRRRRRPRDFGRAAPFQSARPRARRGARGVGRAPRRRTSPAPVRRRWPLDVYARDGVAQRAAAGADLRRRVAAWPARRRRGVRALLRVARVTWWPPSTTATRPPRDGRHRSTTSGRRCRGCARTRGELGADPARMVLIGRSAGAQLALVAAYQAGAPAVAGVVSFYGPVFLADGWREPPRPDPLDVRAVLETYLGGTPDQVPDRYAAASPVTYVSPQSPPTLLVYGRRDHIVRSRFRAPARGTAARGRRARRAPRDPVGRARVRRAPRRAERAGGALLHRAVPGRTPGAARADVP